MDDIVDLVSRSDDELRALIAELEAEEREISRQRRILQGKLDILRAELVMRLQKKHSEGEAVISAGDVEGLKRILAGQGPLAPSPETGSGEACGGLRCSVPSAGSRNSDGAGFCARCGASLAPSSPTTRRRSATRRVRTRLGCRCGGCVPRRPRSSSAAAAVGPARPTH